MLNWTTLTAADVGLLIEAVSDVALSKAAWAEREIDDGRYCRAKADLVEIQKRLFVIGKLASHLTAVTKEE